MIRFLVLTILVFTVAGKSFAQERVYMKPQEFVTQAFNGKLPKTSIREVSEDLQIKIDKVMEHNFPMSRVKYWQEGVRKVFVLEEIGKVKPITTGFILENDEIVETRILIYRESHGGEVKEDFFTNQFKKAKLNEDYELSNSIDTISGATLSVNAITRLSKLALLLNKEIM